MKRNFFPVIIILCFLITFLACSNKSKRPRKPVSTIILSPNKKDYTFGDDMTIQVKTNIKDGDIEKVELYYENKLLTTEKSLDFSYKLENISKLGANSIKVVAIKTDSLENTRYKSFNVLSDISPKEKQYEIVNEYPHSVEFFTQGLEVHNGFLYESTGQKGNSAIRKIVYKTGNVVSKVDLAEKYFGEGITIMNDKIYQLTYHAKKGFVYNLSDFALIDSFSINSPEGWGLTNDGEYLIMSDGTNKITWINPNNGYSVFKTLFVANNKMHINGLNELEYVDGSIFANVWTENYIIEIDSENGKVISSLNLSGLYDHFFVDFPIDVLNGIAFNKSNGYFLVTGKYWPILFEINILESE